MVFGFVYLIDNKMINRLLFKEHFSYFDKKIVVEIIDIFIEEYDERIIKLTQFINDKNIDDLRKAIHAFKGVISNFDLAGEAYKKAALIEHETSVLLAEIKEGRAFSKEDSDKFFAEISNIFEVFKTESWVLLNELKQIRSEYC
jgi:HPt (histidine-containing phosphotransfer) domain-containing protein